MSPPAASPVRDPTAPRPRPPSRRGLIFALCGAALALVIYVARRRLPPPFTVRLDPCLARPDGPGPTPRIEVAGGQGPLAWRTVIESNGRWTRTVLDGTWQPVTTRRAGCVAPETFAPFFARLQSPPGAPGAPGDLQTRSCVLTRIPTTVQRTQQREDDCERPDLAADILDAVAHLTPAAPPPPTAACEVSPCEVSLIDGETGDNHGGGRRHTGTLRRDGRFICDDGDVRDVVHGTLSPAEPLFEWLTRGLAARPLQPEPDGVFTLAVLRRSDGEASIDDAAVLARWRRIAARLPPWCNVPNVAPSQ